MAIDYFYGLTPRQFNNILTGFIRTKEFEYKNSWEQTRSMMHTMLLPHQKRNKQGKVTEKILPTDILIFPWENEKIKAKKNTALEDGKSIWDRVDEKRNKPRSGEVG